MNQPSAERQTWDTHRPMRIGFVAVTFFVAVVVVWGMFTSISGAVLAAGRVQVTSIRTALQHPDGGIVSEILVDVGDRVAAGDVVLRLDDTNLSSELKAVEGELFETLANSARFRAIIRNEPDLLLDPLLAERQHSDRSVAELLERQRRQLQSGYRSADAERESITARIEQVDDQISGSRDELASKYDKLAFLESELERVGDARERGLVSMKDLQDLREEHINTEGDIGRLSAGIAGFNVRKLELELTLTNFDPSLRTRAEEELNKLQRDNVRLLEKRNGLLEELSRLEVRAPISGTIHDVRVEGLQSVAAPGKPLMFVVPGDRPISVAARVDAGDIDQVTPGQSATLKFTSYDLRTMPNIYGEVSRISPDSFLDPLTRAYYYEVEVSLPESEIAKVGDGELISGMPVSVYLSTTSRSPIAYLLRPLTQYLDRAFRET